MGTSFSSGNNEPVQPIQSEPSKHELYVQEFHDLHTKLEIINSTFRDFQKQYDLDGDGVVTKEELEKKMEMMTHDINSKLDAKEQLIQQMEDERAFLCQKIDTLSKENAELHNKLYEECLSLDSTDLSQRLGPNIIPDHRKVVISEAKINEFVETILADPNLNSRFIFDPIERVLYRKVTTTLMNSLTTILKNTSIEVIGHKIEFTVKPCED